MDKNPDNNSTSDSRANNKNMADISTKTTTYTLGTDNVTYFEVTVTTFDNGRKETIENPVGGASILTDLVCARIKNGANALATDARGISRAKYILNELKGDSDEIAAITGGQSPMDKIQSEYQDELLTNGWTIDEGAGFIPVVFSVSAQGQLRYNVNNTGNKNARMYGAVLRLNNYPAAPTDTDFFLTENGKRYFSLPNKNVIIKKP